MRTNYTSPLLFGRGPRRRKGSAWRTLVVVAVVCALVGATVVWRATLGAWVWHGLVGIVSLREQLDATDTTALRDELARAKAAVADRDVLAADNIELRRLLGGESARAGDPSRRGGAEAERVMATVLQRPPQVPYDTLLLDVGARHGVAAGNRVFAGGSVVLGEISEVFDGTARATLYSAPGREWQATLYHGVATLPLALVGQGGGSFVAEVPGGSTVAVGDSVVFGDLALPAQVSAVIQKEGESFMQVYLHAPVNLFELRYVEVEK